MSTATSRKLPVDVLTHPDIVALIDQGKASGHVTADALRTATDAAVHTPAHLKALLRLGLSPFVQRQDRVEDVYENTYKRLTARAEELVS